MGPIDYSIDVQTPFQSALQGYQAGAAIRDDQAVQQQKTAALQQQQRQSMVIQQLMAKPNANAEDYSKAMIQVPGLKDQLKQAWDTKNTAQQQSQISNITQWTSAIQTGKPEIASGLMRKQADAMESTAGGPTRESQALKAQADVVDAHPEFAGTMMKALLAAHPEGGKVITALSTLGKEQRDSAMAPAEQGIKEAEAKIKGAEAQAAPETVILKNAEVRSQINERSARLGLDKDKLQSEVELKLYELKQKQGELPEYVAKDLSAAATEAISSQQSATKMDDLANQIEAAAKTMPSGIQAKVGESWKAAFGNQNDLTRIRAEYNRIVTPAAMAAYKTVASGSTSDRDIDTAMTGVPKDTDSPARMASFLRGAAKLQKYDSILSNAKAEWLGEVRNLGKANKDVEIDGVKVPAGTTFKQFTDSYLKRKVVESRPYMSKYSSPAPVDPSADTVELIPGRYVPPAAGAQ